ncbi:hypothetical protein UAY_00662 [Enterococcus moraviensis ATCC BAA-383]|uniref:Uncharacterized protein n=1 Tax=Enterococcus moraviensis ATCC BAA-383 TaxID=1158609 RepID=R2RBG2_9ENTE|nr:hypothetical protein [Enterococcus moraviensis]EOI04961.1 hypothetical protein UAY_00662 [Enterococcus moraviensis ATCC BAA-383]EOT63969.1 hypothetical protein I586_03403 [Enterococcus moraviensis ATCC BAA-383]OJG65364.1 hypothetical protein RV09_GL001220 [Enterococcus moraviensis]
MANDFFCDYKANPVTQLTQESQGKIKIIQLFVENGCIKIGKSSYPIVYGDVYFINEGECYSIEELEEELIQNTILFSAGELKKLAKILDFESDYEKIFEKNGHFHVASPHYKAIDKRFREAFSVIETKKSFSKALFLSRVVELLNYAVVTLEKRK